MSIYMLVVVTLSLVVGVTAQGEDASCLLQGQAGVKAPSQEFQHNGGIEQDHGGRGHVYSFDDLPDDCKSFANGCLAGSAPMVHYSSWNDTSAAFEACCLGGHHDGTTCKSIAKEAFGGFRKQSAEFELTASVCTEMKDLYLAHTAWAKGSGAVQLLQTPDTRASAIVSRMLELQHEAPVFVKALLLGATVATGIIGSGVSLAQLSMSAMLTVMATRLQQCDWSTYTPVACVKEGLDRSFHLKKNYANYAGDPWNRAGVCCPEGSGRIYSKKPSQYVLDNACNDDLVSCYLLNKKTGECKYMR